MSDTQQIKIPATYMRGGTSKGVFFRIEDLPSIAQCAGSARDKLLLRVIGSPDPYKKQIDGMGGATSSTSKTVLIEKSNQPNHDVDYYFGQVSIDKAFVDWSGNCGNLSSAVGPFAIASGYVRNLPDNGIATVRIWQANIQKTIIAQVPMKNGKVQEIGTYMIDGIAFGAAEIKLDFVAPVDPDEELFPTGNLIDTLSVPDIGDFEVTMISAGIPTIFLDAAALGYSGTELQEAINTDEAALERFERIRSFGAVKMGLISDIKDVNGHTPKIAFVSPSAGYTASSGKQIAATDIDLNVRALSMGALHHAMMGTASVAIGCAACVEGTLVNRASGGGARDSVTFGHPSGTLKVGASIILDKTKPIVQSASMSRSARIIMQGSVFVPADTMD